MLRPSLQPQIVNQSKGTNSRVGGRLFRLSNHSFPIPLVAVGHTVLQFLSQIPANIIVLADGGRALGTKRHAVLQLKCTLRERLRFVDADEAPFVGASGSCGNEAGRDNR